LLYRAKSEVSMTEKRASTKRKAGANAAPARKKAKRKSAPSTRTKAAAKAPAKAKARKPSVPRPARKQRKPILRDVVLEALADMKAVDIKEMDVRGLTDITDTMVVASGTSDRHVRSIADRVVERCKKAGFRPYGIEGERDGEWVLLDLQDLVLHVMQPRIRDFYALEKLWERGGAAA